jgi:integrase
MNPQTALTISAIDESGALVSQTLLERAGQAANHAAAQHVFERYRERKAENTIRRQQADLGLFSQFLREVAGIETGDLFNDPAAWRGVTWGLVQAWVKWMLDDGYAVGSVNVRLSTVKTCCKLAAQAGTMMPQEYAMVKTVSGYKHGEAKRIDDKRQENGQDTRIGDKKPEPVLLSKEQARWLKRDHPDTPQGRRDRLMMCILLDHGLRVGELSGLTVGAIDLEAGTMTFYREKVDKQQTHELTKSTLQAARRWLEMDALRDKDAPLLRGSQKGGALNGSGMTTRAISARVRRLGISVGLYELRTRITPKRGAKEYRHGTLSAHDCRHYWATMAARCGTPIDRLMDAGGWSSPAMPLRYVDAAKIANQGVSLGEEL